MIWKTLVLTILTLLISSVSACSFKIGTGGNQAVSEATETKVRSDENSTVNETGSEMTESAAKQNGGKTGTYKYKAGGANNQISIQEIEGNKLRVELYASYEYKTASGLLNANVGEAKGVARLAGDTAVFVPDDAASCEISLRFSGNKLIVKAKNEIESCGFGLNVSAEGTYTKTSGKPDFNASEGEITLNTDSPSNEPAKTERISFAPGKSSTVVSGKISSGEQQIYLVGARAGQTMLVEIIEGGANNDVVLHIVTPNGSYPMGKSGESPEYDAFWSGKLPQSGDYKIVLGAIESKNVNFKMSVEIR
ncbi:MAG TPA: hypothetical protein VF648_21015 [Pyrinomonadaceae bacterium]|jgi:hypothetical protein